MKGSEESRNALKEHARPHILRRLLCRIGLHDWHVLESKSAAVIDLEVACELNPLRDGEYRGMTALGFPALRRKSCLCCGKTVNQIDAYRKKRLRRMRVVAETFGVDAIEPRKWKIPPAPPPPPKVD